MPIGDPRNTRLTEPPESEYREELASQLEPAPADPSEPRSEALLAASSGHMLRSVESDPRPTSKMSKDELGGLLGRAAPAPAPAPSDAAPTPPRTPSAREPGAPLEALDRGAQDDDITVPVLAPRGSPEDLPSTPM